MSGCCFHELTTVNVFIMHQKFTLFYFFWKTQYGMSPLACLVSAQLASAQLHRSKCYHLAPASSGIQAGPNWECSMEQDTDWVRNLPQARWESFMKTKTTIFICCMCGFLHFHILKSEPLMKLYHRRTKSCRCFCSRCLKKN